MSEDDKIAQLLSMFRGTVEAGVDKNLTGIDIVTDPLTNEEVMNLFACVEFQLCHILTPPKFTHANQDPNVLSIIAKNRVSNEEVVVKLNVPDAVNRLTTITGMYEAASAIHDAELELEIMQQVMGGKTENP